MSVDIEVALKIAKEMQRPWKIAFSIVTCVLLVHLFFVYLCPVSVESSVEAEKVVADSLHTTTSIEGN